MRWRVITRGLQRYSDAAPDDWRLQQFTCGQLTTTSLQRDLVLHRTQPRLVTLKTFAQNRIDPPSLQALVDMYELCAKLLPVCCQRSREIPVQTAVTLVRAFILFLVQFPHVFGHPTHEETSCKCLLAKVASQKSLPE